VNANEMQNNLFLDGQLEEKQWSSESLVKKRAYG